MPWWEEMQRPVPPVVEAAVEPPPVEPEAAVPVMAVPPESPAPVLPDLDQLQTDFFAWLSRSPTVSPVEARMRDLRALLGQQQGVLEQLDAERIKLTAAAAASQRAVFQTQRLLEAAEEYLRDQAQRAGPAGA